MREGEVADLRVVAIQDELGSGQLRHRGAPPRGDGLELAVPVELVAKKVAEQKSLRLDAACDLGQRGLVDLEEPELGAACPEQGGGDAGNEVRARIVVRHPQSRAQDLRDHRGRRRLAVGRRDEHRSLRQPACEQVDRARIELPEQLSRQRCTATTAEDAGELPGSSKRGGFGREGDRKAHECEP